jgi:polar amino acid transport system substrate-binding protein
MIQRRIVFLAAALALSPLAMAACSRPIVVPVAASGVAVSVEDGQVRGIYPDLMRSAGQKAGCEFQFSIVPRARQVALFESGKADLLVPASPTAARDQLGVFVPMISHRTMIISVAGKQPPITSLREVLERRELRMAVVRGFDYGEPYTALIKELSKQGRLFMEVDVRAVARLLHAGSADITIMGPTLMAAAIEQEPRVKGLQEKLRFEAVPEMPWHPSGIYISRSALTQEDQREVRELLEKIGRSGAVIEAYHHRFRPELLNDSVRGR